MLAGGATGSVIITAGLVEHSPSKRCLIRRGGEGGTNHKRTTVGGGNQKTIRMLRYVEWEVGGGSLAEVNFAGVKRVKK